MTENQQKTTSTKIKITTPIRVNVGVDETDVTVAIIAIGEVSTCHFILLVGYFQHVRIALLHHTTAYFPSSLSEASSTSSSSSSESQKTTTTKSEPKIYTAKSVMLKLISEVVEDLDLFLPQLCVTSPDLFKFNCIKNVKVLIGDTFELTTDVIYDGFELLSDNNIYHELKEETIDSKILHLIQQLYGNVEFRKLVTYYQSKTLMKLDKMNEDSNEEDEKILNEEIVVEDAHQQMLINNNNSETLEQFDKKKVYGLIILMKEKPKTVQSNENAAKNFLRGCCAKKIDEHPFEWSNMVALANESI
ncbi:unnamed protein product [Adineta steineri]|uniref:Uncharacterized protein n=1 Tax=Adineta steineri TaxID=433720 RepID=A0A819HY84_9BILA|nr:unnamed protein product [Adineta steineri]